MLIINSFELASKTLLDLPLPREIIDTILTVFNSHEGIVVNG